jgi:hypothetical protein
MRQCLVVGNDFFHVLSKSESVKPSKSHDIYFHERNHFPQTMYTRETEERKNLLEQILYCLSGDIDTTIVKAALCRSFDINTGTGAF